MALLGSHGLQRFSLDLSGLVVQEDPDKDEGGARGAEDGDVVTEHDDAKPNRQSVFDGTGDAVGEIGWTKMAIRNVSSFSETPKLKFEAIADETLEAQTETPT